MTDEERTIDVETLTEMLGLPPEDQEAVFSFSGELDRDYLWTPAEAEDVMRAWREYERAERG